MPLIVSAAAQEATAQLVMPNWAFPLIVAVIFVILALVSFSFRDVANRHADREPFPADPHQHDDAHAGDAGDGHQQAGH